MLSAIGDAVHAVQGAVQAGADALPLPGKDKGDKDTTADAPAGQEEEEAAPEFTTTSKAQEGSGTVTTVADVPPPSDQDTFIAGAAAPEKKPSPAPPAPAPTPQAADAGADVVAPSDGPMNQLRNLGGGSVALPSTPKKWRKDRNAWHPDAAGVHYAPGFFINKHHHPVAGFV